MFILIIRNPKIITSNAFTRIQRQKLSTLTHAIRLARKFHFFQTSRQEYNTKPTKKAKIFLLSLKEKVPQNMKFHGDHHFQSACIKPTSIVRRSRHDENRVAPVHPGEMEEKSAWKNRDTQCSSTMDRLEASRVVSCHDDVDGVSAGMIDSFMGDDEDRFSDLRAERSFIVAHEGVKRYTTFDANRSVMLQQKAVFERCYVCSLFPWIKWYAIRKMAREDAPTATGRKILRIDSFLLRQLEFEADGGYKCKLLLLLFRCQLCDPCVYRAETTGGKIVSIQRGVLWKRSWYSVCLKSSGLFRSMNFRRICILRSD